MLTINRSDFYANIVLYNPFVPFFQIIQFNIKDEEVDCVEFDYDVDDPVQEVNDYLSRFDEDDLKEISHIEVRYFKRDDGDYDLFNIEVNPIKEEEEEEGN